MSKSRKLTFRDKAIKYLLRRRKIDPVTGCWLFTGSTYQSGYSRVEIEGKRYFVQRLSLYIWREFDLSSSLLACHKIECLNKHCFNPEHLYAGTAQDNINDAITLGHLSNGLCFKGHKLVSYYSNKGRTYPKRYCKICQAERAHVRRKRISQLKLNRKNET